jgi:TrmH family RNA methyltransferase
VSEAADRPVRIESARNPRISAALELRERRARDRAGRTLVDGVREVGRALDGGIEVVEAFVDELAADGDSAVAAVATRLSAAGAVIHPTAGPALERLGFGHRVDGVVAVVRTPTTTLAELALPDDPLLIVLEGVEKPGNLGAVSRSADGAGADALLVADPTTDPWNPNAIRASLGTIFGRPVVTATSAEVIAFLRERAIRPLAAIVEASTAYTDADLSGPIALVLGSEADGLGPLWRAHDIERVHLPMHGLADSLNVSTAAAILLYEARRQRGTPTSRSGAYRRGPRRGTDRGTEPERRSRR